MTQATERNLAIILSALLIAVGFGIGWLSYHTGRDLALQPAQQLIVLPPGSTVTITTPNQPQQRQPQ